jgi:tRNA(fMet)-specific endonuclease VapC
LIDTDVISNLLKRSPSLALVRHLASVDAQNQFTSSVTLGELVYGAHRVPGRTASLLERIDAVLGADLPVLPFDASAARRYGEVRAWLERAGTPIGDADVRIASIALVKDLVVVTGNVRHFGVVPDLRVEDWLT